MEAEALWLKLRFDLSLGKCYWIDPGKNHESLRGKEAGFPKWNSRHDTQYWIIKIDGVPFKRANLMFFVANGRWPSMVDHRDGNSLNDAPCNLREATVAQNNWNHRTRKKKSPMPMGIRGLPSGRFQVRVACNKRTTYQTFGDLAEAQQFYLCKRREYFGEFCGQELR
jgi:hypothetical protein